MEDENARLKELVRQDYEDAKKPGRAPSSYLRLRRSEEVLGSWFLKAFIKELSLEELRQKGDVLRDCMADYDESDLLLDDAFGFLDDLHDLGSRATVTQDPEILRRYAEALTGEIDRKYYFRPYPGVELLVTYEKRK